MQNLAPELEHPRRPEVENEDREMPDLDPAYAFRITSRIMRHLNKNYFRSRFVGFEQPIRVSIREHRSSTRVTTRAWRSLGRNGPLSRRL